MTKKLKSHRQVFTDAVVRNACLGMTITDMGAVGLRLRVAPTGLRTFYHLFRLPRAGKRMGKRGQFNVGPIRKITLGHYPSLSLAEARDMVRENMTKIREGVDPRAATPSAVLTVRTFADVAAIALADAPNGTRRRDVGRYLLPVLGKRPIEEITGKELAGVLDEIDASALNRSLRASQLGGCTPIFPGPFHRSGHGCWTSAGSRG